MGVVFLIGAAQGVFLALVLASRSQNVLANRLLAALVLVFSVDLAMAVYHTSEVSTQHPALIGLDLPIAFLYGPLLYLYVRTLSSESPHMRRTDALHLVPFVGLVVFLLPFFLLPGPQKVALVEDPSLSFSTRALAVVNPLKLVHGVVYLGLVWGCLRRARTRTATGPSAGARVRLAWLRNLSVGVLLMLALATLVYAVDARNGAALGMDAETWSDDITLLAVTLFVYALGYFGLRQPEIAAHGAPADPEPVPRAPEPSEPGPAAYARSGMRTEEAVRQRDQLVELMERDHLYRRGDLTLQELADSLGVSAHNLTEILSTQLDQSFYDFVNGYRVRDVQRRLADPDFAHWTVLAIGMEAGFKAKSSFNAAFKRFAGMTPSQYRAQHGEAV